MKKLSAYLFSLLIPALILSCNSGDDNTSAPATNSDDGFIISISQVSWVDTAGATKTYFFGEPDSVGRFTGVENDNGGNQNFLSGRTFRFDISFTVIKDQFSTYVDYAGKLTDTLSTHKRMVIYSNVDTLYLKPQ